MSGNIDERIVQMQFQNSQFESGVKESLKTLERLKESLKLDKAAEGLQKLQDAGNSFSLANVSNSVDNLTERFSAFGTFAARIIENLADTVYRKLGGALESVTIGQIANGWQRYAEDTQAVQTIMFATDESIEEVEAELERLTWFTDETSYNYADMVGNISKFTSAGVGLKDARVSMEGIAVWAASAGQNAQTASRAMYNISQAMGMGSMKVADWKSIELANMATKDFKNNAIEAAKALGKIDANGKLLVKTGKKAKKIQITSDNFRETLQYGWFDKDVMNKIFGEYGEFAEKVKDLQDEYEEQYHMHLDTSEAMEMLAGSCNLFSEDAFKAAQEAKTFSEAIDALRDAATTKWMNIFKLVFGNYENAKVLWTKLANDLYEIFVDPLDELVRLLKEWHKVGDDGRSAWDDFMDGIYDIMDGLKGILITVRNAFGDLIPDLTIEKLSSFSTAVKEFGATFKAMFGIPEEVEEEVKDLGDTVSETKDKIESFVKGETSDAFDDAKDEIKEVEGEAKNLEKALQKGARGEEIKAMQRKLVALGYDLPNFGVDGIWGPETDKAFREWQKAAGLAVDGVYDEAAAQSLSEAFDLRNVGKEFEALSKDLKIGDRSDEVKKLQERLIELGYDLDQYGADGIWGPETQKAYEQWQKDNNMEPTGVYDQKAHEIMKTQLGYDKVLDTIEDISNETDKAGESAEEYGTKVDRVKKIFGGLLSVVGIAKTVFQNLGKTFKYVWDQTEPLRDAVLTVTSVVAEEITKIEERLEKDNTIEKWFDSLRKYLEPIGSLFKKLSGFLLDHFGTTEKLESTLRPLISVLGSMAKIAQSAFRILYKIGTFVWNIGSRIIDVLSPIWSMLSKIFGAGIRLFAAFADRFDLFSKNIEGSNVFTDWLSKIDSILPSVKEKIQSFCDTILSFLGISGDLNEIDFDHVVDNVINSLKGFFGISADAKTVGDMIDSKSIIETVKTKIIEIYTGIKNWIVGLFTKDGLGKEGSNGFKLDGYKLTMGAIAGIVALIGAKFYQAVSVLVSSGKKINKILGQVKGVISSFKMYKKAEAFDTVAEAILKFAGAIAILVASVYLLTTLSWGNLLKGLAGLGIIMAMFIGSIFALKAASKGFDKMASVIESLEKLGIAIGVLAGSVLVLSGLSWKQMAVGLVATAGLMLLCVGAIAILSKMKINNKEIQGTIGLFVGLSISISNFAKVIQILGQVDTDVLIKGFIGLAAIMFAVSLFVKSLDGVKLGGGTVASILAIAGSIDLLIGGFVLMSFAMKLLTAEDLIKGFASFGVIVFALVGLLKAVDSVNPNIKAILALIPIAVALNLMVLAFMAMMIGVKFASTDDLINGVIGIAALIFAVIGLMKMMENVNPNIKAVLALIPIAIALDLLALGFIGLTIGLRRVTTDEIINSIAAMAAIMLGIVGLMRALSGVKPTFRGILAMVPIALALDIAIAGFIVLAMAMQRMNGETLIKSIGAIGAICIAVAAVAAAMTKITSKTKPIKAIMVMIPIVLALATLSAVFVLLAKNLDGVKSSTLMKTIASFVVLTLGFGLLVKALAEVFNKNSSNLKVSSILTMFLGVAAVIAVFGYVISKMKDVDPKVMLSFSGSLAIALASFVGACMLAGKFGSGGSGKTGSMFKGALSIVGSLVIFAATALLFVGAAGFIDKWLSNNGYEGVFENGKNVLTAVGNALVAFGNSIGASIQTVAEFLIASEIVGIINKYAESNTLLDGAFSIVTALALVIVAALVLVGAAGAIDQVMSNLGYEGIFETGKTVLTTVGTALTGFCESIGADIQTIGDFLLTSEIIGLINQYTGSNAMISGAWSIAAALSSVIAAALIIVGAAGFIDQWLGNIGYESVFETGKEVLQSTAEAISGFMSTLNISMTDLKLALVVGAIIGNAGLSGGTIVGAAAIGIAIDALIATLELFVGVNGWVNKITDGKWTEYIKEGGNVLQTFGEALAGFISGFTSVFITQINDFGTAIANVREAINGLSTEESEGTLDSDMETALGMAQKIHDFFSNLEPYTTITFDAGGGITYENNANTLSTDIEAFGRGMATLWNGISGISTDNTFEGDLTYSEQVATDLQSFFAGIADKMPSGQGLKDYNKAIDAIMGDVATFGTTMNSFRTNIEGFGAPMMEYDVETAVTAATAVADFCEKVGGMDIETKAKGIAGWFSKETSQETVIDTIGELANSIAKNGSKFRGLSSGTLAEDVKAAMKPMYQIASFLDFLSDDNMNTTDAIDINGNMSKLNGVLSGVGNIAHSIKGFSDYVGDIDLSSIASVIQAVTNFIGLLISDTNISPNDIFSQLDVETISARFSEIITAVNTSVNSSTNIETLKNVGQSISDNVISGLSKADTSGASSYVTSMTKNLWSFSYYRDFFTIGQHFANGLSSGVYANARYGVEAAAYIAKRMVNEIKSIFATASPSKVTKKIGEYFSEGLALGVDHKSDTAIRSTEEVAESMLNTAQGTLTNLSDLLADDIDTTPTISPVVDLTNARNAAASISDLFGGNQQSSVTMTRTLADKTELDADGAQIKNARVVDTESALSLRDGIEAIKQGLSDMGSGDVVNEIQSLSDKFGSLAEAVLNMKLVLDTGALVGGTYAAYDRQFGKSSAMADRGN